MKKLFTQMDFIGFSINSKINSENLSRSLLGGLLSLLIYILSFIMIIYLGLELVKPNEPRVTQSMKKLDTVGPFNFSQNQIEFFLGFENPDLTYYADDRIFSIKAEQIIVKYNGSQQIIQAITVPMRKCSEVYSPGSVDKSIPLDLFYCVKPGDAILDGFWGAQNYYELNIKISKCKNSTLNNNKCKSRQEIDATIQNGIISMFASEYLIDAKNYTSPINKFYRNMFHYLSSENGLMQTIGYTNLLFTTDVGSLFQEYRDHHAPTIYQVLNDYSFGENEMFANVVLQCVSFGNTYLRNYSKIQDVVTQMGGLIKGLSLIANFLIYFYSKAWFIIKNYKENHYYYLDKKIVFDSSNTLCNNSGALFGGTGIEVQIGAEKKIEQNFILPSIKNSKEEHIKYSHKLSEPKLFLHYWCGKKENKEINMLKEKEQLIFTSMNIENCTKMYFDLEMLKLLLLSAQENILLKDIYNKLFNDGNPRIKTIKKKLLNENDNLNNDRLKDLYLLFDREQGKLTIREKLTCLLI
jgi:hypothetical protein